MAATEQNGRWRNWAASADLPHIKGRFDDIKGSGTTAPQTTNEQDNGKRC